MSSKVSHFNKLSAAGWKVEKLGNVIQLEYGKGLPDSKRKPNGKYSVFGANGEKARTDEFNCSKPSIIVGRKGSAGEINLSLEKSWVLDVSYFVTFDDKKYDLFFLYYLLNNLELPKLAKGVKPGINRNEVYAIDVNIPPLPEQKWIVSMLDETFAALAKAHENAERNLVNAREVFDVVLTEIFYHIKEKKKLGDLCNLVSGFSFKSKDYVEFSNTMNFRMSQIRPGGWVDLDHNPRYLPDSYAKTYKEYLLKDGDIVIAMTDMATETKILGVPTLVKTDDRKLLLNQRVGKFFDINYQLVNVPYLKYVLSSKPINDYYKKLGRGGLQINIGKQDILNAQIPLPPLGEQRAIVSKLEALSAETKRLEEIYQQKIESLEELKKSVLQKAFAGEL